MKKKIYNINDLIDIVKEYSLNLHKTTFRYGIDYIKSDSYLKEKYPEIFKELEEYFLPRKVNFIYYTISDSMYPVRTIIEIGNKYELETMIGVPKAIVTPINGDESKIEDLKWVSLNNLSENEINEYKNKLTLTLNIVNYNWLNQNKIDEIIELVDKEITASKFIDNLKTNKYDNIVFTINKLNLEERMALADNFNQQIRKDCLNFIKDKRQVHNWLDSLSVIPTELLSITYDENEHKIYI